MALPTLNLDDRDYPRLLEILKGHIPGEEWSDHNPSDPGIALLEMLAWLGEMALYRMNRVPASHRDKFLKLLADPPVPVTAEISFRLTWAVPPPPGPSSDFELPPGLRFATDYAGGRRFLFESFGKSLLAKDADGLSHSGRVRVRAFREIQEEALGVSDGRPNQVFPIGQGPVLTDFGSAAPTYNPNPRVRVGAVEWELRNFLLAEGSRANPLPPRHFMVDGFDNRVRFGDDTFGAIPPAGDAIALIRYQVLEGPEALVGRDRIRHFLNPEAVTGLAPGDTLVMTGSSEAQGGENFFPPGERMRRGLEAFRNPARLITAGDFERAVLSDFNGYRRVANAAQGLPEGQGRILRAEALMNRKPPLSPATSGPASGHVTLLILPGYDQAAFRAASLGQKTAMLGVDAALKESLLSYLEPRRLLTTRLHVEGAGLMAVSAQVGVVVESRRNAAEMEAAIRAVLNDYLDPARGYDDGRGWPLGRALRRSRLYRLLEDLPGVDHVETLSLTPASASGDVEPGAGRLPVWDGLSIGVSRA